MLVLGPWNHAALAAVGAYIGYNYTRWEKSLLDAVNQKRKERGLPEIKRSVFSGSD